MGVEKSKPEFDSGTPAVGVVLQHVKIEVFASECHTCIREKKLSRLAIIFVR